MQIPSRAFGFVRSGLNGRFGVLAGQEAATGDFAGVLAGTYTLPDDDGVELCPVPESLPSQGSFYLFTDGAYVHGPITGSDPWTARLYYYRPGQAAAQEASGSPATINDVGGAGAGASVSVAIAGSPGALSVSASVPVTASVAMQGGAGVLSAAASVPVSVSVAMTGSPGQLSAFALGYIDPASISGSIPGRRFKRSLRPS